MKPETKELRDAVKRISGAWVRVFRDGTRWAGSHRRTIGATLEVQDALEAAGFVCVRSGKWGTAGEYIIEVYGKAGSGVPRKSCAAAATDRTVL